MHQRNLGVVIKSWNSKKYDEPHVFSRTYLPRLASCFLGRGSFYDVVHCHFGKNGLKGAFLRRIGLLDSKTKLVTTFHGLDLTQDIKTYGKKIYVQLFEQGDLFLPISNRWKKNLVELGCEPEKIRVHHMGVNLNKFSFRLRKQDRESALRLVSIARLVEKKGIEYAIRAIAELVKTDIEISYTIIGDGPLRKPLENLTSELSLENYIEFVGWKEQQEVISILNNSDILLAPSVTSRQGDQEGIPVTLMEAMAMGIPVVSTWHSGIPELVKDGVSGYLVPERDPQALARKVTDLIRSPENFSSMSSNGREFVENFYNLDKLNDQLVKLYEG